MAIWRDVVGYEGLYKVSNKGEILSIKRKGNWRGDHLMIPQDNGYGYPQVCMSKNGKNKTEKVHQIVAKAFIPNPEHLTEINHIDEDKWNCSVNNLEWCSRQYNVNYGTRTQRTSKKVAMYSMNMEFIREYNSIREACRENNMKSPGSVSNALKGKSHSAYGYKWMEVI